MAALRRRMAWMGQKPHVFAGSVQANVALGRAGVQPATGRGRDALRRNWTRWPRPIPAVGAWARAAAACRAARRCGWRWRASAVHPDADLLLVDEPTAHLDTETAERVADALLELARGKTLIVATHDPVLAARMHRVIRLDDVPAEEAA